MVPFRFDLGGGPLASEDDLARDAAVCPHLRLVLDDLLRGDSRIVGAPTDAWSRLDLEVTP